MPERSPEIEQVVRDSIDAIARSDFAEVGRLTSRDDCTLSIGTDASEWCEGHDQIMQLYRTATPEAEFGIIGVGLDDVTAFREDRVGWAAGHGYFEMQGARVPIRLTAVMYQEDGEWKAIQSHYSIGVPNDQIGNPMFQGDRY